MFQTVKTSNADRTDHVWKPKGEEWKCVICGGITKDPPDYPTPEDFHVDSYEKLTDEERRLSPNLNNLKEEIKK